MSFLIFYISKEVFAIINSIQKERSRLVSEINHLSEIISKLPAGKLIHSCCKDHIKWYLSNGSSPIYISKKEKSLAKDLALRKYYTYLIEEYQYKLQHIEAFIQDYDACPNHSLDMLSTDSCYSRLLKDSFLLPSEQLEQWQHSDYRTNSKNPEHMIHKCVSNHYVRSKSEVIIANALFRNKIPYRYECELILGGITIYPDFTICHPNTQELFYWEHFGLMDNRQYRQNVATKIVTYGDFGIYPSINLITTYETSTNPIDSGKIEALIQEYFL